MSIFCVFGHRLNRNKVWHDGLDYRSRCVRCEAPMIRETRSDRWRVYNPARDDDPGRLKKPGR